MTMRTLADKVRICAANNADLYEAVFRAHGLREQRNPFIWWSESPAPPYYSNMTTLDPDAVELQLKTVEQLRSALEGPFAVKDGFCRLDLADLGFKPLFDASWIWLDSDSAIGKTGGRWAAGWQRVRDADALHAWEDAWTSDNPSDRRMFPPAILDNPDVAFLERATTTGFDAGCIVNRSRRQWAYRMSLQKETTRKPSIKTPRVPLTPTPTIFRSWDMREVTPCGQRA